MVRDINNRTFSALDVLGVQDFSGSRADDADLQAENTADHAPEDPRHPNLAGARKANEYELDDRDPECPDQNSCKPCHTRSAAESRELGRCLFGRKIDTFVNDRSVMATAAEWWLSIRMGHGC